MTNYTIEKDGNKIVKMTINEKPVTEEDVKEVQLILTEQDKLKERLDAIFAKYPKNRKYYGLWL
jgi:hypothetical protein